MQPNSKYFAVSLIIITSFFLVALLIYSNSGVDYNFNLQQSYSKYNFQSTKYEIAVIADMDTASRLQNKTGTFKSSLIIGDLTRLSDSTYSLSWRKPIELTGEYNEAGRGLELSELVYFNNKLLACDDRTGIIYEIEMQKYELYPRWVLPTGDGNKAKGFKCEWMTVKNKELYIGSTGKEWSTKSGKLISFDTMWIKVIDTLGRQRVIDWRENYLSLTEAIGIHNSNEGYIVHEAVNWNPFTQEWTFLPRRVANEKYNDETESTKGSNHLFIANEDFTKINVKFIGNKSIEKGFSTFKFFPHRSNEVIALKTVELNERIETYITVIDMNSNSYLLPETLIKTEANKYEGIEFI